MVMEMIEEFVVIVSMNLARLIFLLDLLVGCSTIWDELLLKIGFYITNLFGGVFIALCVVVEAAATLTEFELKKILLDKLEKSKSYRAAKQHRDLYDALVKFYQLDKDLFGSYGKPYSLKRGREDKDKDEDPPAGLDQGLKKRHTSKDTEPLKGSKLKELKSSYSKGSKSQSKSSGKSAQGKEPVFETTDTEMPQDQGGTCKSRVELEFHFEECYKVVTNKIDWTNPEGHEYQFDLSKTLPLIEDQGHQVVPANYFNNDLKCLKGGSLSSKYTTSTTKTNAAKYDTIEGIEDMVPLLWSPVKNHCSNHFKVVKKYDYGYLDEIIVQKEDQQLYKFIERDFLRLNLRDIEDMLLLLVQKKLSNLERDDLFDLNVALRMFIRRVVILKRVEDPQRGVKSYQKKLNITRPKAFRSDITKMNLHTAYNNPQRIIYQDKFQINRLICSDKLYKFCDDTLSSVQRVLHDISSILEMDYLPKGRWSKLDKKSCRIMIKAID
uniref:Uncharacterized protein n=1 Tax=Tanacetum cinerariifolium TaxID=118510 RepID=A0A699GHM2_TANCI|nr:hypothetical protein [Tanacetum cinerariifolium]